MDVTREDVLRCAALAHLSLREDEVEPMRLAMARMLTHAASLDELALDQVEPMLTGLDRPCPAGRTSRMTPSPRPRLWPMRRSRIGATSSFPRCCSGREAAPGGAASLGSPLSSETVADAEPDRPGSLEGSGRLEIGIGLTHIGRAEVVPLIQRRGALAVEEVGDVEHEAHLLLALDLEV